MSNRLTKDPLEIIVPPPPVPAGNIPGYYGQTESTTLIPMHAWLVTLPDGTTNFDWLSSPELDAFNAIYQYAAWPLVESIVEYRSDPAIIAPVTVKIVPNGSDWALFVHYLPVPFTTPGEPTIIYSSNDGWNSAANSIPQVPAAPLGDRLQRISVKCNMPDGNNGSLFGVTAPYYNYYAYAGTSYIALPGDLVGTVLMGFLLIDGVLTIINNQLIGYQQQPTGTIAHSDGDLLQINFDGETVAWLVAGVEVFRAPLYLVGPFEVQGVLFSPGDYIDNPAIVTREAVYVEFPAMDAQGWDNTALQVDTEITFATMTFDALMNAPMPMGFMDVFAAELGYDNGRCTNTMLAPQASAAITGITIPDYFSVLYSTGAPTVTATMVITEPCYVDLMSFPVMDEEGSFDGVGYFAAKALTMMAPLYAAYIFDEGNTSAHIWENFLAESLPDEEWIGSTVATAIMVSNVLVSAALTSAAIKNASMPGAVHAAPSMSLTAIMHAAAYSQVFVGEPAADFSDPGTVWVLNASNSATSTYRDYPFTSYAKLGQTYFGVKEDGIYALDGDDDAGVPTSFSIAFGKQNFGVTERKRVPDVYIGVASTLGLVLKVTVEGTEYYYQQQRTNNEMQQQRFILGRGLEASYMSFELLNPKNTNVQFELSSVQFNAIRLTRRQ